MRKIKKITSFVLIISMLHIPAKAENMLTGVKSAILIEPKTNTVLYEQDADEKLPIASVTKIMTMLIILEKVDAGELKLTDIVTASPNAESYGGSTMFLEVGEQFPVSDMLKGIAVASANDGCIAMAEHIAGSEENFVELMNKRAKELGMTNTNFANCNGLDDDVDATIYHSSARDVAIMSKELIKHEKIFDYTTIWTDSLRDGKFLLANTNKLIRNYSGATGLKTGSTSKAGCCLSATANRDGMELVSVVLGADSTKTRFDAARTMLDYGYRNYKLKKLSKKGDFVEEIPVLWGEKDRVSAEESKDYYLLLNKSDNKEITENIKIDNKIFAPIKKGDKLGTITFICDNKELNTIDLVASEDINKLSFVKIFLKMIRSIIGK